VGRKSIEIISSLIPATRADKRKGINGLGFVGTILTPVCVFVLHTAHFVTFGAYAQPGRTASELSHGKELKTEADRIISTPFG
jgi:hypothetical protein